MSEMESAQETTVTPAAEAGHAAGPGDRPVPGEPVPAAPTHQCQRCGRQGNTFDSYTACPLADSTTRNGHFWGPSAPLDDLPTDAPTIEQPPSWSRRMPGKDKVAIVGFSTNHRHLAPLGDPEYEIWGLNNAYVHLKRADRWFELHSEDQYGWDLRRPGEHIEWLKKFKGPLYLIEQRADMPKSIAFPYAEVIEMCGPYLTSGPALMLAFAMLEGFKTIAIYGIDLMTNTEYADQKPGFEFLLGLAMGREIEVILPSNCDLLKGPVYGRGDVNAGGEHRTRAQFEGRLKALAKRKTEALQQLRQHELTVARIEGAELESRYWIGQTPEGASQNAMLKRIAEEKGRGGVMLHPTGDLADRT